MNLKNEVLKPSLLVVSLLGFLSAFLLLLRIEEGNI